MKLDGASLQIFANYAASPPRKAWPSTLDRTAHSTFVKETEDFTTGVATPEGHDLRGAEQPRRHLVRRPRLRPRDPR